MYSSMNVVQSVTDEIFAEPDGHPLSWAAVGWGVVLLGSVVGGLFNFSSGFVFMGVGFVFMGGAELVPADRHRLAGILRVCSMVAFTLLGLQILIPVLV